MDSIEVSGGLYVSKGSHVQLTEVAKTRINYGELYYRELMDNMKEIDTHKHNHVPDVHYDQYLIVSAINNNTIYVKIPHDKTDSTYIIYEPIDLESIKGPETPPARPYNKKFKRTRRNNRKRKTRRSSNRK
jgi:hypothetical protein